MQERIKLTPENVHEAAKKAALVLRAGGIVLYPTDTLYGLGADSLGKDAFEKIYATKGRNEGKPIHSIFENVESAERFVELTPLARTLAEKFLPGPLTLLLAKKVSVPDWATAGHPTFGVRVPNNQFCLALAHEFGEPYTATSANKSGEVPERTVDAIVAQLGKGAARIDLIIDAGELQQSPPSSVVDARGENPVIVREGAIPSDAIVSVV